MDWRTRFREKGSSGRPPVERRDRAQAPELFSFHTAIFVFRPGVANFAGVEMIGKTLFESGDGPLSAERLTEPSSRPPSEEARQAANEWDQYRFAYRSPRIEGAREEQAIGIGGENRRGKT